MRVKTVMGEFSTALAAWPAIREAASTISATMLESGDLAP
jgi:hypothetical protein